MKFREIFRFEFTNRLRRVSTWLFFIIVGAVAYLMIIGNYLYDARNGDFFLNAPWVIAMVTILANQLSWLMAASLAGGAAARDVSTGIYPLMYSAPISKTDYLGGRFLAAFTLNALIMLAVPIGILFAVYSSGLEADILGPFRPVTYLSVYFFLALPNAFIGTAIQFSLAALSRRTSASYIGGILLIVTARIGGPLVALLLGVKELGYLVDPTGVFYVSDLLKSWATSETNIHLVGLEGPLLTNRLLWIGISLGVFIFTYRRFQFSHSAKSFWRRRSRQQKETHAPLPVHWGVPASALISIPQVRRTFDIASHLRQVLTIAGTSFRTIMMKRSSLFYAFPFVLILLTLPGNLEFWNLELMTVPLLPRTEHMLRFLTAPLANTGNFLWVIISLLIIFYAEKLVWTERGAGLSEMTDAAPVPEWVLFLGKYLGLSLVLVTWLTLLMAAGMFVQVRMGYYNFEIGLYLQTLYGFQLSDYLLFALLVLVIHMLVNQKQIGRLVALTAYGLIGFVSLTGIEHNLLIFGADPGWSYTDMRGFGPSLGPWLWFKLYWVAWGLLLAVLARLFWVRSTEASLKSRIRLARARLTRPTAGMLLIAVGLIITLGGFIFYNTNILNTYHTASERMEQRAEYERRYGQYEDIPQPRLTNTNLQIELYPKRREAEIHGTYDLVNSTDFIIDSIHVATVQEVETSDITFDRAANRLLFDEDLSYRIYALEEPLQPSDSLKLYFEVQVKAHGFSNSGDDASVVANGTYFTNQAMLPAIGYQRNRELINAGVRRSYGLDPRPAIPSLYDVKARQDMNGSGKITFEAVLGTDENQIAVAPGVLRREWIKGGRRYFHYTTDAPIRNEYAIFSADYAVHEAQWNDPIRSGQSVAIQIYHHPGHDVNVDRVVKSMQVSLDYCTEEFGPYGHSYIRLIEYPGHGSGLHAESTTITHQEGLSLMNPEDNPQALDFVFAVIAHEMGHACRGIRYAPVEGAGLLSESLAWYRAMRVLEKTYGTEHLNRLRAQMLREAPIPPKRINLPLLQAATPYLNYRKGPFAMYALDEYLGEEQVRTALQRLHEKQVPGAPPAISLDLYSELQAVTPDSLGYLLHDLFEANIIWSFDTERTSAVQTEAGDWQVTLDVRARKVLVDTAGVETSLPLDDWVEIGVFAPSEGVDWPGEPLYLQKHRITSERQTITVPVPQRPAVAGIDPYDLLDWEDYDIREIEFEN